MATRSRSSSTFSSSSSSDEDESTLERDDEIRRKLLTSFYGNTTTTTSNPSSESQPVPLTPPRTRKPSTSSSSADKIESDFTSSYSPHNNLYVPTTPQQQQSHDPLDSPSFNAKSYTRDLLQTQSAYDLLNLNDSLNTLVKSLDSKMQTLVYDNYSKFITATDAIRVIGLDISRASTSIELLSSLINDVDEKARVIDGELSESRNMVLEKLVFKRQLERISVVINMPDDIKLAIAKSRIKKVVEMYVRSYGVLERHCNVNNTDADVNNGNSIFLGIKVSCDSQIENLVWRIFQTISLMQSTTSLPSSSKATHAKLVPSSKFVYTQIKALLDLSECNSDIKDKVLSEYGSFELMEEVAVGCVGLCLVRKLEVVVFDFGDDESAGANTFVKEVGSGGGFISLLIDAITLHVSTFPTTSATAAATANEDDKEEAPNSNSNSKFVKTIENLYNKYITKLQTRFFLLCDTNANDSTIHANLLLLKKNVQNFQESTIRLDYSSSSSSVFMMTCNGLIEGVMDRRISCEFLKLRFDTVDFVYAFLELNSASSSSSSSSSSGSGENNKDKAISLITSIMKIYSLTIQSLTSLSRSSSLLTSPTSTSIKVKQQSRLYALFLASTLESTCTGEISGSSVNERFHLPSSDTNNNEYNEYNEYGYDNESNNTLDDITVQTIKQRNLALKHDVYNMTKSKLQELVELSSELRKENGKSVSGKVDKGNNFCNIALMLAEACRVAGEDGVVCDFIGVALRDYNDTNNNNSDNNNDSSGSSSNVDISDAYEISQTAIITLRFTISTSRCLSVYTSDIGYKVSNVLCLSMRTPPPPSTSKSNGKPWYQTDREVREVRESVGMLFGTVKSASVQIGKALECRCCSTVASDVGYNVAQIGNGSDRNNYNNNSDGGNRSGGGYNNRRLEIIQDVNRMFLTPTVIFPSEYTLSRSFLIETILKIAIKSIIETSRTLTFSYEGYRQIYVDLQTVRVVAPHYVEDCGAVNGLLDDASFVCKSRTVDMSVSGSGSGGEGGDGEVEELDKSVEGRILEKWLEKWKGEGLVWEGEEED